MAIIGRNMWLFQYIVIKLHLSDTVVFDYPQFPKFLTHTMGITQFLDSCFIVGKPNQSITYIIKFFLIPSAAPDDIRTILPLSISLPTHLNNHCLHHSSTTTSCHGRTSKFDHTNLLTTFPIQLPRGLTTLSLVAL